MHDYSIHSHPKAKIFFVLSFIAISVTPQLNSYLSHAWTFLQDRNWVSGAVTAIPVLAVFGLVNLLFEKYLWKVKPFRRIFLVPDLNGHWKCHGNTHIKDGQVVDWKWAGEVEIRQSWSRMTITFRGQNSSSKSVAASISQVGAGDYRLIYNYQNDPKVGEIELQKHGGAAEMVFPESCESAEGSYFTDQHRLTVGAMRWERVRRN